MIETYRFTSSLDGNGTFYYTDCGNRIYAAGRNPMRLHGRLCPKCFMQNKYVTLYLRGTKEAEGSEDEQER